MKRTLTAALALVLTSTSAFAICEPTYITRWSYEYNSYMTYQGPDRCYFINSDGQVIYQQPIQEMPPPVIPAPPVVYQDQVLPNGGAAIVGGLIGAGIGYAIGRNNNQKNNYYYYNNGHKHKDKRYRYPGGWNNGEGRPGHKNRQQPIGDGD